MKKSKSEDRHPAVLIDSEVARQIRQHARSCSKTEVCGVLIGSERDHTTIIEASIAGLKAAQAGTHVTFTQDTWEHIYKTKDKEYPDHRIVGWYHSHPGFGVFLSDHDTFIHQNFFSSPRQVAWVYDPHSDEEGCFGWIDSRIERLAEVTMTDGKGGEKAGETGRPEPVGVDDNEEEMALGVALERRDVEPPGWLRGTVSVMSYLSMLALGFLVSWFLFPRSIVVPVPFDAMTGHPMWQYVDPELRDRLEMAWPNLSDHADPSNHEKKPPASPEPGAKAKP